MSPESPVTPLRSISWAVEHGSHRDLLVALRDKLWTAFHDERTQPRDLSPLTLRIRELTVEIEAIDLSTVPDWATVEDGDFDESQI